MLRGLERKGSAVPDEDTTQPSQEALWNPSLDAQGGPEHLRLESSSSPVSTGEAQSPMASGLVHKGWYWSVFSWVFH